MNLIVWLCWDETFGKCQWMMSWTEDASSRHLMRFRLGLVLAGGSRFSAGSVLKAEMSKAIEFASR